MSTDVTLGSHASTDASGWTRQRIDAALLNADSAGRALLYRQAAVLSDDPLEQRFFLTQSWVHALSAGNWPLVARLEVGLRRLGGL
ncbi:MAG: hypothetical protein AAGC92_16955 [Pseudomonadota bacterium]